MKKVLSLIAAIAMVGMLASCDQNGDDNGKNNQNNKPVERTYADITIDGQFADWAALESPATALVPVGPHYPLCKTLKAAAGKDHIYIYFEYELFQFLEDKMGEDEGGNPIVLNAAGTYQLGAPFEIFINSDFDNFTGGSTYLWEAAGYEWMFESEEGFLSEGAVVDFPDKNLYIFDGEDGKDAWEAGGHISAYTAVEDNFITCAGVIQDNVALVEIALSKAAIGVGDDVDAIELGVCIYDEYWAAHGCLPSGGSEDPEAPATYQIAVPMLQILL